ncbi:uncharacterized protein LOC141532847 isoform X1 [Cotesia typhae]|uniref:uncharacterized protein LOC141532847 isoform X1 n=1 Tax=Cotesia typhae TaxID=2053667 RepID=UPI003D692979
MNSILCPPSRGMPLMHEKKHIESKKILLHLRCCTGQQKSRLSAICEPIVSTSSANKDKEKERARTTGRNMDQHECGPKILERRRPLIKDLTPATYNGEPDPRIKPSGPHLAK